jgi:hypothetical protein
MTTPTPSILDRLARLASQRTARTDRLHEAACALLDKLNRHVPVGTRVSVGRYELCRAKLESNVGSDIMWFFGQPGEDAVDLESPLDADGYLHGDFDAPYRGPSRHHLIAFAMRAGAFVAEFVARQEKENDELDAGPSEVESAIGKVP